MICRSNISSLCLNKVKSYCIYIHTPNSKFYNKIKRWDNIVCTIDYLVYKNIEVARKVSQSLFTTDEFVELDPYFKGVTVEYLDKDKSKKKIG